MTTATLYSGKFFYAEFFKSIFFKKFLFIRTTNSLDSDQAGQSVGHDMGTNRLLWFSDATGK